MEYINDVNINEAVINILDTNGGDPILNNYSLDLTDDIYRFIYKHIERCLNNDKLRCAKFNEEKSIVKEVCQDYLYGNSNDLINLSKEISKQMFAIMNGNTNIPPCDLITASIVTDKGPMIAILKLDYSKNFTHDIQVIEDKIGIDIIANRQALPGTGQKIKKAAFIKPIRDKEKFDLLVLDLQNKRKIDEEYGDNYFINNFLGCNVVSENRYETKMFINSTEYWIRQNLGENPVKSLKVREKLRERLFNDEKIDVDSFCDEVFNEEEKQNYKVFIAGAVPEVFEVDDTYVDKKLKKIRLKLDNSIDLYIPEEEYRDSSKFEVVRNGDGTVNLVLKFVTNIIEK